MNLSLGGAGRDGSDRGAAGKDHAELEGQRVTVSAGLGRKSSGDSLPGLKVGPVMTWSEGLSSSPVPHVWPPRPLGELRVHKCGSPPRLVGPRSPKVGRDSGGGGFGSFIRLCDWLRDQFFVCDLNRWWRWF